MEEKVKELPKGWVWTRLGEICIRITKGSTPTSYGYSYKNEGIKFIKTENILQDGTIANVGDFIDEDTNKFLNRSILQAHDILFSIAGTIGRVGLVQEKDTPANTNQALSIIRLLLDYLPNKYIFYFLKSPLIQRQALKSIVGVGRANISLTDVSNFDFPLPPILEQHRIVAKVEELFTRLDAGVEALKKIKAQLKRYRQAVLKYAFEGKLTQEWREANKGKLEPASVLLERIREERKKDAKGKYKELPPIDTCDLPELPEGWEWTGVGNIYDIVGGGTPSTMVDKYWEGDIPWITSADIIGLKDIRPRKHINKEAIQNSASNLVPEYSLVVVTRVGLGKIALTKTPLCFSQDSQALVGNKGLLLPDYSLYYLSKAIQIFKYRHRGTTIAGVTKKQLSELPFALPPRIEQDKIVEEIESRLSVADNVESVAEQSLKQSERLRQSILKRAFEGKLVPQDPTDEPANKLLDRIKEEKVKREGGNRKEKKHRNKNLKQMELT